MYEYFLFFWILWMIYIIVYFFMDKSKKRQAFLIWILCMISSVNFFWGIANIRVSIVFVIILIGSICLFIENIVTARKLLYTFMIMISYGGLLIWHQIAPIWYFLPPYIMIPILLVSFVLFLERKKLKALPILLLGMSFGQCIYQFILITYHLTDEFVQLQHLVQINVAIVLLVWIHGIDRIFVYLSDIVHRKLI